MLLDMLHVKFLGHYGKGETSGARLIPHASEGAKIAHDDLWPISTAHFESALDGSERERKRKRGPDLNNLNDLLDF